MAIPKYTCITDAPDYRAHFERIAAWLAPKRQVSDLTPVAEWDNEPKYVAVFLDEVEVHFKSKNLEVSRASILRAERSACGHSDYHRKLALYLTELERGTGPGY